jgi:8-oxo-dGTP pyrophosphatase MutT (NUDIX family)
MTSAAQRPHVERLVTQLEAHQPFDPRELRSLARTRTMLGWLHAPFDETSDPWHVTSSAIVMDPGGRVLLHKHKRLGIWLQPGGHIDTDESCEQAVLREVTEETGLVAAHDVAAVPLHIDLHEGPRGHVHLDVRWLLLAPTDAEPDPPPGESQEVLWLTPDAALARTDVAAANAIHAALRRTR